MSDDLFWKKLAKKFEFIPKTFLGKFELEYSQLWYTMPVRTGRMASQRWHRDPPNARLCKVFLYLSDIDRNSGALWYVKGSVRGCRWWPRPGSGWPRSGYPPERLVSLLVPAKKRQPIEGPLGTLIWANTHGLHRGGHCTQKPRLMWTAAWTGA